MGVPWYSHVVQRQFAQKGLCQQANKKGKVGQTGGDLIKLGGEIS